MFTVLQLEIIADAWREEAEAEGDKYYFETEEFKTIASGRHCFVISRKGTGKSAIAQHLKKTAHNAVDLSLSDLDPEEFERLGGAGSTADKLLFYRNAFEYIIYRATALMMLQSTHVAAATKERIREAFPDDVQKELPRKIMRWMELEGHFEVLGVGAGFAKKREEVVPNLSMRQKKNILEEFLREHLKDGPYYVIFDALDDNYRASVVGGLDPDYGDTLTCLFKTVKEVKRAFPGNIFPVITLRDDIFDFLQHAERNRWLQDKVEIKWDEAKTKNMIAHRIAKTIKTEVRPFEEVWLELVGREEAKFNARVWQKYSYIASFTMLRPRDFIYYVREACKLAAARAKGKQPTATLSVPVLKGCIGPFSSHLRREIEDEIGGQIRNIHQVIDAILATEVRSLSRSEFEKRYNGYVQSLPVNDRKKQISCEAMLNKLYDFGVIGYADRSKGEQFRFSGGGAKLPAKVGLLIHKGLIRARDEDNVLFAE